MASENEEIKEELQPRVDALKGEIGDLEENLGDLNSALSDSVRNIESIKAQQANVFNKYGKDMQVSFKEYFVGDKAPASQKDLKEVLSGLISKKENIENKKRKSKIDKEELSKLSGLIDVITKDLEQLHQLGSEKSAEDKNKKNIENEIVKNNEELAKFREALRALTDANKGILNKIEQNTDEIKNNIKDINNAVHSTSNDTNDDNTQELNNIFVEISKKLDNLNNKNNNDDDDDKHDNEDVDDGQNYDKLDDLEEEVVLLDKEKESVGIIKQDFKDLSQIIDNKNDLLDDENQLIEDESEKLDGAVSKFKDIHKTTKGINTDLKDGQETLAKIKNNDNGGSSMWSFLTNALQTAYDLTSKINNRWNEIQDNAFKYGRQIGMSAQQMRNYQKSLFGDEMRQMMLDFSMEMEEFKKLETGFIDATGRAVVLSKDEMEAMATNAKYIDSSTVGEVADKISEMGGSIVTSQEYLASTMARAQASGLNMAKHSANFAKNIKLASKYNFKNGLSDISKMTALTDRWKANLGGFADGLSASFENIESSISTAAKLQVLGGSMAARFSNPLEMMNMAQTDLAGMMESFQSAIKDVGKFNKKSGVVELSAMDRAILKEQAKALNLNFDEVLNVVNAEGKATAIESQISSIAKFSDTQREWLKNVAEYDERTQKWFVTYHDSEGNRKTKNIDSIKSSDELNDYIQSEFSVEEKIQSDVQAIREHLLGRVKEKAKDKATSSYLEKKASFRDMFELGLVNMIDPAELIKVDVADVIRGGIPFIMDKIAFAAKWLGDWKPADTWNGWMESLGKSTGWGWTEKAQLGSGTTNYIDNKIMPALGSVLGIGLVASGLGLMRATPTLLHKGGKSIYNKVFGGRSSETIINTQSNRATTISQGNTTPSNTQPNGATPSATQGTTTPSNVRNSYRNFRQTIKNSYKKAMQGFKVGGLTEAAIAAFTIGANAQEAGEERNKLRKSYGTDNLDDRLKNKNSFYAEALAESKIDAKEKEENSKAIGRAIGGTLGATVGNIFGPIGGIIGGMAGTWAGGYLAPMVSEVGDKLLGKSDKEQLGIDGLAQRKFETTKIGLQNIKTKDDLFEQAAIATVGIHDLLITKFNNENGLLDNGQEKDRGWVGNTTHSVKNFFGKLLGFNEGGIVHNGSDNLSAPNGDTTVIAATENEMVLTREQQSRLFAIANGDENPRSKNVVYPKDVVLPREQQSSLLVMTNGDESPIVKDGLYNSPTHISSSNSNFSSMNIGNNMMSFSPLNININGTLKLDGGNGKSKNIDINEIVNNTTLIRMLAEAIDKNTRTVFNGGTYNGEHSAWKLSKV